MNEYERQQKSRRNKRNKARKSIIHSLLYCLQQYISLERLLLTTRHKERERGRENDRKKNETRREGGVKKVITSYQHESQGDESTGNLKHFFASLSHNNRLHIII